ncbi:hypothetical protein SDC9_04156 [bioreactor metagenome]|uniref:Uncharacterized protein n=1 Tax=bioreactor metagenome TaxID=1076179 RepID=A0A644SY29_9ZZZZ|nr:hypothetical protein [Negativicutes bacterium]MEA4828939.1 hypothetical protein [Enterococcus thailandicus]
MPNNKQYINLRWLIWNYFDNNEERQDAIEGLNIYKERNCLSDQLYNMMLASLAEDNSQEKQWVEG